MAKNKAKKGNSMAKNEEKNPIVEMIETNPEFAAKVMEQQFETAEKQEEERKERIRKLSEYEFDKRLGTPSALTRKERKAMMKDINKKVDDDVKVDPRDWEYLVLDSREQIADWLLDARGVKDPDDLTDGEILLWTEAAIYRSIHPLEFEGN